MSTLSRDEVVALILRGTGTEDGIHRAMQATTCARKVRLDEKRDAADAQLAFARDRGTVFHALAAGWHMGVDPRIPVPGVDGDMSVDDPLYEILDDAHRLFDFYAGRVPPDGWGMVLAAEMHLDGQLPGGTRKTGQADLVVRLDGELLNAVIARTGLPLLPGVYLVDHKTSSRKDSELHVRYFYDLQPKLYQYLYEQQTGVRPIGFIINQLVAHKKLTDDSMCAVLVEPPTEHEIRVLTHQAQLANRRLLENETNPAACMTQWGPCRYLLTGECNRL